MNDSVDVEHRDENGKYHRDDAPARMCVNEISNTSYCNGCDDDRCKCGDPYLEVIIEYYYHGLLHREGAPAKYYL